MKRFKGKYEETYCQGYICFEREWHFIFFYRAPINLYYTLIIVKNCQVVEPSTKLFMLFLTIPTIIIVPVLTFLAVFVGSFFTYFVFTVGGYPLGPWKAVKDHYGLFWKFYVEKAQVMYFSKMSYDKNLSVLYSIVKDSNADLTVGN